MSSRGEFINLSIRRVRPDPPLGEVFTDNPLACGLRVVSKNFPSGWVLPDSPSAEFYKFSPSGKVFTHCSLLLGYVYPKQGVGPGPPKSKPILCKMVKTTSHQAK